MSNRQLGKIRNMWRMYQLLRQLRKYPYREEAEMGKKFTFQRRGIEKKEFVEYLKETRFLEDWRQTFLNFSRKYFGYHIQVSEAGVNRVQKRNHAIDLIIDGCRKKRFLEPTNKTPYLKLTGKGWRFSGFWRIGFINECFKEYGCITSFIFGILGGAGGTVLIAFWNKIIALLLSLLL